MTSDLATTLALIIAFVLANLPWLHNRFFLVFDPKGGVKAFWMSGVEWMVYFVLAGALIAGLEKKVTGSIHSQEWEFYVVVIFMYMIFTFPAFVYRFILKKLLTKRAR